MAGEFKKQILTPEQMTDFLWELKTGDRILSIRGDDDIRVVVLKKPTRQNETDAKIFYAALYATLLKEGLPTRAEARKEFLTRLANTGVDTADYEARKDAVQHKLAQQLQETMGEDQALNVLTGMPELLKALDRNLKTLSKDELALLHIMADNEAMEIQIMSNCAEAVAETESTIFLLSQVAHNTDGSLLWPTPEAANQETDAMFLLRLQEEFRRYRGGFPLLFEVVTPSRDAIPNTSPSSSQV